MGKGMGSLAKPDVKGRDNSQEGFVKDTGKTIIYYLTTQLLKILGGIVQDT